MALVAGDPEQVGPLLSAFAFDHVIGFGARLEVHRLDRHRPEEDGGERETKKGIACPFCRCCRY
jgi:hypothetical protein